MRRLKYKGGNPNKWWEKILTILSNVFINIVLLSTLILSAILIYLSVYYLFTGDLIKFTCSVILILTFVYVNKS